MIVFLLLLVHTGLIILVDVSQAGSIQNEVSKNIESKLIPLDPCPQDFIIQDGFCPCYCSSYCSCNPKTERCNYHTGRCDPRNPCPCLSNKLIVEATSFPKPSAAACASDCVSDPDCQFWVYNQPTKKCALRYFQPYVRAYSVGNFSGKKSEPLSQWSLVENSVWVAQKHTTYSCEQCWNLCRKSSQCKSVIFNKAFGECSFNYGGNSLTAIPLPPAFNFLGIASAFKNC